MKRIAGIVAIGILLLTTEHCGAVSEDNSAYLSILDEVAAIRLSDWEKEIYKEPLECTVSDEAVESLRTQKEFLALAENSAVSRLFYVMYLYDGQGNVLDQWLVDTEHKVLVEEGYSIAENEMMTEWLEQIEKEQDISEQILDRVPGENYLIRLEEAVEGRLVEKNEEDFIEGIAHCFNQEFLEQFLKLRKEISICETKTELEEVDYLQIFSKNGEELYRFYLDGKGKIYTDAGYELLGKNVSKWAVDVQKQAMKEKDEMEEQYVLTKEQEKLLIEISMDEDRVKEGKLYGWQLEILKQYDFAMDYLYQKYPSYQFSVIACTPKNKMNAFTSFRLKSEEAEDVYDLYLEIAEDGNYECKDNFYSFLLEEDYGMTLLEMLKQEIPECVFVESKISAVKGVEYNESIKAETILKEKNTLTNLTTIYVDGSQREDAGKLAEEIEKFIGEQKLYGSYIVIVLSKLPEGEINAEILNEIIGNEETDITKKEFQQFD